MKGVGCACLNQGNSEFGRPELKRRHDPQIEEEAHWLGLALHVSEEAALLVVAKGYTVAERPISTGQANGPAAFQEAAVAHGPRCAEDCVGPDTGAPHAHDRAATGVELAAWGPSGTPPVHA